LNRHDQKKIIIGGQTMEKGICLLCVLVILLTGTVSTVSAQNNSVEGISLETAMPAQNDNLLLASNQDRDQDHDRDRDRDGDRHGHKHRPNCGHYNKQACHSHYPDCCWASSNSHSGSCGYCR
jgi:hypothetical protein